MILVNPWLGMVTLEQSKSKILCQLEQCNRNYFIHINKILYIPDQVKGKQIHGFLQHHDQLLDQDATG